MAEDEDSEPEWKSRDTIRSEVDIERQRQEASLDSLDARAGLLLGFAGILAGVLAGLTATQGSAAIRVVGVLGATLAAAAAVFAAMVLWPRTWSVLNTKWLFEQYIYEEPAEPAKEAFQRRIKNLLDNEDVREAKVNRLRQAIVTLIAAILLTVVGLAVQTIVTLIAATSLTVVGLAVLAIVHLVKKKKEEVTQLE